jgi:hypothetical protein
MMFSPISIAPPDRGDSSNSSREIGIVGKHGIRSA